MVAHGAHFLYVSKSVWVTKMWAFEGCLQFCYISNLGWLPSEKKLLWILIHNNHRFSDIFRISTWRENHDQQFESGLPPTVRQLDPNYFWIAAELRCRQYLHRNT